MLKFVGETMNLMAEARVEAAKAPADGSFCEAVVQKVMCLGADIHSRRNTNNPQFEQTFGLPVEAAKRP